MTEKAKGVEVSKARPNVIELHCVEGEDEILAQTRALISPSIINAGVTAKFAKGQFGLELDLPSLVTAFCEATKRVNENDMRNVEATLICQATALNTMFGELSRRAALNMGEYLDASERYMRMALKAQNQCRMTLETLSNIKNPPVVYAKQANITNGPQQVNNTLHAHTGENQNQPSKVLDQSNDQRMDSPAQGKAGDGNSKVEAVEAGYRT